jgi:hypothetical protein
MQSYIHTYVYTYIHTYIHTYAYIYRIYPVIQIPFGLVARICAEIEIYIGMRDERYGSRDERYGSRDERYGSSVSSVHRHCLPNTLSLS